jgi:PST family polysaccharide transporter
VAGVISPLRATGIVAVGTAVSLAVSVVTSKILALLTGTVGVGLYGLMQAALTLATIVFGLGLSTALVRSVAESAAASDHARVTRLRAGAWIAAASSVLVLVLAAWIVRENLAAAIFGDPELSWTIPLIALAAAFTILGSVEVGALNGFHRITSITQISVVSSVVGGLGLVSCVLVVGEAGIAPGLLAIALVGFLVSVAFGARTLGAPVGSGVQQALAPIREMMAVGLPYTASQLAGAGAQLVLPVVVLYQLGPHSVGLFRAAITISTGYLAFLLTAFAQDYYPRVASARPSEIQDLIERRTRLVMAIAVPIILATLAFAPILIEVLYSTDFAQVTGILEWQLIGDLLKLPAWAIAFAVLARGAGKTFFAVEMLGGVCLVAGVWLATETIGIVGAGIGYLVAYAIYYVGVWFAARTVAPVRPGRLQLVVIGLAVVLALTNVGLTEAPLARMAILLAIAMAAAGVGWPMLWRRHRLGEI